MKIAEAHLKATQFRDCMMDYANFSEAFLDDNICNQAVGSML